MAHNVWLNEAFTRGQMLISHSHLMSSTAHVSTCRKCSFFYEKLQSFDFSRSSGVTPNVPVELVLIKYDLIKYSVIRNIQHEILQCSKIIKLLELDSESPQICKESYLSTNSNLITNTQVLHTCVKVCTICIHRKRKSHLEKKYK